MDDSWDAFQKALMAEIPPDQTRNFFSSKFEYLMDKGKALVVDRSMEEFARHASLISVFNPKLSSIRVRSTKGNYSVEVRDRKDVGVQYLEHVTIAIRGDQPETEAYYLHAKSEAGSVAVPLSTSIGECFCQPIYNTARLFLGFPLIGTENFNMPAIVNSFEFGPAESRDGIYLGCGDDEVNRKNADTVSKLCKLHADVLRFAAGAGYRNIYNLAHLPPHREYSWVGKDWGNAHLRQLIDGLRGNSAVLRVEGAPLAPKDTFLPVASGESVPEDLWDLVDGLRDIRRKLPRRDEASGWCEAMRSWATALGVDAKDEFREAFCARKLAEYVHDRTRPSQEKEYGMLTDLISILSDGIDPMKWLDNFYTFLYRSDAKDVFNSCNIVLDQAGYLDKLGNLYRDDGVDDALKNIADDILDLSIRAKLRDRKFQCFRNEVGKGDYNNKKIVDCIVAKLNRLVHEDDLNDKFTEASTRLFWWIVEHRQWDLLDNYPAFARGTRDDRPVHVRLQLLRRDKLDDMPLAPVGAWPEDLRRFADLFAPEHILADEFSGDAQDGNTWKSLEEKGLVRYSVLYSRNENVDFSKYLPGEIDDDRHHRSVEPAPVMQIAQFAMDRVRDSHERSRLFLTFLFEWLSHYGVKELNIAEGVCECGETHRYYPAAWLAPVAQNKWIRWPDEGHSRADARSISRLICEGSDRSTAARLLEKQHVVQLLNAMNIRKFDIVRELMTDDDADRDQLDNMLATIMQATGGDLEPVEAFVKDLEDDSELPRYMEERRARRQRVRLNRDLGERVEVLVRKALEESGFSVSRTGIGHDFEVERARLESLEDEEQVISVEITKDTDKWFVEVKATRSESVRMTRKQAKMASESQDRFILCVVPVEQDSDGFERIEPDDIRDRMKFVLGIGQLVSPLWRKMQYIEDTRKAALPETEEGVNLEIQSGTARVRVDKSVWSEGLILEDLVKDLKRSRTTGAVDDAVA